MNEKIIAVFIFVIAVLLAVFCSGCGTVNGTITDDSITASETSLARLQAANDSIRDTNRLITGEVDNIRETAGSIGEGLDRAIYFFNEYEKLIQRVIDRLRQLEHETRIGETESSGTESDTIDSGNPFPD